MNMIRHHTPGEKVVTLRVEEEHRVLHERADTQITQPAGAVAGIEVFLNPRAEFLFSLFLGEIDEFALPLFKF